MVRYLIETSKVDARMVHREHTFSFGDRGGLLDEYGFLRNPRWVQGEFYRAKLTFKRFADTDAASEAYAYHVTKIEVLTGTIGNDLSGTAPNANTLTTNQVKTNLRLTPSVLLNGVADVNGMPFLQFTDII